MIYLNLVCETDKLKKLRSWLVLLHENSNLARIFLFKIVCKLHEFCELMSSHGILKIFTNNNLHNISKYV